jgi:putative ABC transport system permease protein
MRYRDVLRLALSALYQQKVRTLLTTLGVVFGSFVLLASLSIRSGIREAVFREYGRFGELRRIVVSPSYSGKDENVPKDKVAVQGKMSEARRKRLRRELIRQWRQRHTPEMVVHLTPQRLKTLAALDHVTAVNPFINLQGRLFLEGKSERVMAIASPDDKARQRIIAGDYLSPDDPRGVVLSEFTLYLLGVADDADLPTVLGKKVRLECKTGGSSPTLMLMLLHVQQDHLSAAEEQVLAKMERRLPELIKTLETPAERKTARRLLARPTPGPKVQEIHFSEEYTIRGVMRLRDESEIRGRYDWVQADLLLLPKAGEELFYHFPNSRKQGFGSVMVEVDDVEHVKEVATQIRAMGLQAGTMIDFIEREQLMFLLIFSGMTAVALVSLLVAALGIINTMLMSVLERVREIGIMKAVGARDGHIQLIFLVEGALVGLVGGLLGLLLGWAASFPGDAWVRSLAQRQLKVTLHESIFSFPIWLVISVPAFACLVTTLAALYPARRAARVNPIIALRHD